MRQVARGSDSRLFRNRPRARASRSRCQNKLNPLGLFLILVVVSLDALDDDVIWAFFVDRPLAAVGVIA
jgi:hypothetical protein